MIGDMSDKIDILYKGVFGNIASGKWGSIAPGPMRNRSPKGADCLRDALEPEILVLVL